MVCTHNQPQPFCFPVFFENNPRPQKHSHHFPSKTAKTYRVYETEMIRRRGNNARRFFVRNSASSAPQQRARVQHRFEIRRLSQAQSIVVFRVECFRHLAHPCASVRNW